MKKLLCVSLVLFVLVLSTPMLAMAETTDTPYTSIKTLLNLLLEESYYHSVECNESGTVIRISDKGIGTAAIAISAGLSDYEIWSSWRESTLNYANSIYTFIAECGISDPNLLFIVLDDISKDTIMLAIYNGEIIYDYIP